MNRRNLHRGLCLVLAAGNIGFGVLATLRPSEIARVVGETEDEIRAIAMRDLRAGVSLLSGRGQVRPLVSGIRSDVGEAAGWLRRKSRLAAFPIVWVVLGIAALLTRE